MKNARETLDNFSRLYVLLAILTLLLIIPCFMYPEKSAEIVSRRNISLIKFDPSVVLTISYIIEAAIYLVYYFFLRRVVNKKSSGLFISVLIFISFVIGFMNQFSGIRISSIISMIVDLYVLQLLYKIRMGE